VVETAANAVASKPMMKNLRMVTSSGSGTNVRESMTSKRRPQQPNIDPPYIVEGSCGGN